MTIPLRHTLRLSSLAILAFLLHGANAGAQDVELRQLDTNLTGKTVYTDEYLDTVNVSKKVMINDYSMIGVHYGVGLNWMYFNPTKDQAALFTPVNFGITFTKYAKMFGFMPYFGMQLGLFYGQDGYRFKPDKETGEFREGVDQARKAVYDVVQANMLSHFHVEAWRIKFMLEAGMYIGYRLKVHRTYDEGVSTDYVDSFYDYDRRFDYGAQFGLGFGIMLDPIEIHFKGQFRWSLSSLYKPDYNSQYYYRFAYPLDLYLSVGVHYQLGRRVGKTRAQLRQQAKEMVYGGRKAEEFE